MPPQLRRVALAVMLATALVGAGDPSRSAVAQGSCDASYPELCIAPAAEIGDLACADVGVTDFTVYPPDSHGFDGDFDGIGCESGWESETPSEPMPIAATDGCDPSYPEICLAPAPDLDCADVDFALTVLHDPTTGAYDPHAFDDDYDGLGCESW